MKKSLTNKAKTKLLKIDVLCLFPNIFSPYLNQGLISKAQKNKVVEVNVFDLRRWSPDRRGNVDDRPYGGGPGMLLKVGPIASALKELGTKNCRRILLSPQGKVFNQNKALELSKKRHLIIVCGHYEGVDQRIAEHYVDEEISVGDFVLSGGEPAALLLIDAVTRLLPKFMGNSSSLINESFNNKLLDYPQYTRPPSFEGHAVPEVLVSGNHAEIEKWRRRKSFESTQEKRPDLAKKP